LLSKRYLTNYHEAFKRRCLSGHHGRDANRAEGRKTEFATVSMTETCDRNWCDGDGYEGSPNLTSILEWKSTDFRGRHESSAAPFSARADAVTCEGRQARIQPARGRRFSPPSPVHEISEARNCQPRNHHLICGFTMDLAGEIIAWTIASSSVFCPMPRTNDRSIFSASSGRILR
jgi:hypothetical protein